jgi:hypothetical protein
LCLTAPDGNREGVAMLLAFAQSSANSMQRADHGSFDTTPANANGITIAGRPLDDGGMLEQGDARETIGFCVPRRSE